MEDIPKVMILFQVIKSSDVDHVIEGQSFPQRRDTETQHTTTQHIPILQCVEILFQFVPIGFSF